MINSIRFPYTDVLTEVVYSESSSLEIRCPECNKVSKIFSSDTLSDRHTPDCCLYKYVKMKTLYEELKEDTYKNLLVSE